MIRTIAVIPIEIQEVSIEDISPFLILPSWRWVGDDGGVNIRNVLAGKYTPQQIDTIIQNAKKLPYHEQVELMSLVEAYEKQLKDWAPFAFFGF